MKPVSVVVPNHNRTRLLERALRSVAAQTAPVHEVIVVDDASDLDVEAYIPYQARKITRVIRLSDRGNAAKARNHGIQEARGELIAFLDSDDYWNAEHVACAVEAIKSGTTDVVWGAFRSVAEGRHLYTLPRTVPDDPGDIAHVLFELGEPVRTSTIVGNAEFLRHVLFDGNLRKHQDWDLMLRACQAGRIGYQPRPTVSIDGGSTSRMSRKADVEASLYFVEKHAPTLSRSQRRLLYRRIIRGMCDVGDTEAVRRVVNHWTAPLSPSDRVFRGIALTLSLIPGAMARAKRGYRWVRSRAHSGAGR